MKRFTLPRHLNNFDINNSKIFPWTNGRFVVRGSFSSNHNNVLRHQVFTIDDEIHSVIEYRNQLLNPNDHVSSVLADEGNLNFYIPCCTENFYTNYYLTVPDRKVFNTNGQRAYGEIKEPFGGERIIRVGNRAITSHKPYTHSVEARIIFDVFMKNIKITPPDVAIIDFSSEGPYNIKVMQIAGHWTGSVISLAISLDKLTAAALIAYPHEPWEVVVWDLE